MINEFYKHEEAKTALAVLTRECEEATLLSSKAAHLASAQIDQYEIVEYSEPKSWRLSGINGLTSQMEPVRMRFQGIIGDVMLPPVKKPTNVAAIMRSRPHLRQSVTVTGLGSPEFSEVVDAIEYIKLAFDNKFPAQSMHPWEPSIFKGSLAIDCHNRYFTKSYLVPGQDRVAFDASVDPEGHLESMILLDKEYTHTADNDVDYFGTSNTNLAVRAHRVSPTTFREGDIVEVTVEFASFPAANGKYRMVPVMKAIRMLDPSFRMTAAILKMRNRYVKVQTNKLPKRSATYSDDEVEETSTKLARMEL